MYYDILNENGEVINTIVAEQWFVDKYYTGRHREHVEPEHTPEGEPMPAIITVLQLRRLFSFEEKVAVEEAILAGNSALKVFMDDLAVATEVDLSDPLVEQGLDILIASEIITEERKRQILSNEALE